MVPSMKLLVCIKQVCASDSPIQIDEKSAWIQTDAIREYHMNRPDEFAVEEALSIKQKIPDVTVEVISVGPDRSAEVLRRAMGMGADRGIHIVDNCPGYVSPFSIASDIANYARNGAYDLILAGVMSEDHLQGQVGPMIAACLSFPCATAVIRQLLDCADKSVYVEREIEGGSRDTLQLNLPAVLTIQSGINTPRYPSLSNLLRANKQRLETIAAGDREPPPARERVRQLTYPRKSRAGAFLTGSEPEKASRLLTLLREKALI